MRLLKKKIIKGRYIIWCPISFDCGQKKNLIEYYRKYILNKSNVQIFTEKSINLKKK